MIYFTRRWKSAKIVLIVIVLISVPGMLTAQKFRVEGEAGLALFSISDPVLEAKVDIEGMGSGFDSEIDLAHKTPFFIGAYAGYTLGALEIGGELLFTDSKGSSNSVVIDNTTLEDSAGRYDISIFKIGPVIRYYFKNANPQIEPFGGASVSYASATIDISDPPLKIEQSYLNIGIFGGALYWMQENFYVGGTARIDIYNTIEDDSLSGIVIDEDGTRADFYEITTDGWTPLSLFFVIGTRL